MKKNINVGDFLNDTLRKKIVEKAIAEIDEEKLVKAVAKDLAKAIKKSANNLINGHYDLYSLLDEVLCDKKSGGNLLLEKKVDDILDNALNISFDVDGSDVNKKTSNKKKKKN